MSPAAFAMLMAAAENHFKAAFQAEDMDEIQSALAEMRQLHRAYYGSDAFSMPVPSGVRAA
jgi:hypothetical protein